MTAGVSWAGLCYASACALLWSKATAPLNESITFTPRFCSAKELGEMQRVGESLTLRRRFSGAALQGSGAAHGWLSRNARCVCFPGLVSRDFKDPLTSISDKVASFRTG